MRKLENLEKYRYLEEENNTDIADFR